MKRLALATLTGAALYGAASLPAAEPANACSLYCPPGEMGLELVEVRLVEAADPAAELPTTPEWSSEAVFSAYWSLSTNDGTWIWFAPIREEVE